MITAVILTHNEEENIERCLKSISWCDEILVIDDLSTDNTLKIAKKIGSKILTHPLANDFSAQRNFANEHASGEWILHVDADEIVSKKLAEEIQQNIATTTADGFRIKRVDHIFGKTLQYGEVKSKYFVRLGKKNSGKWTNTVHEVWDIQGTIDTLKNSIDHYPHKTLDLFLQKLNLYSTLRAKELFDQEVKSNYFYIIAYPLGKFLETYFWRLGFLDGTAGAAHCMLMSLHSFLVRGKLWVLWHKK